MLTHSLIIEEQNKILVSNFYSSLWWGLSEQIYNPLWEKLHDQLHIAIPHSIDITLRHDINNEKYL